MNRFVGALISLSALGLLCSCAPAVRSVVPAPPQSDAAGASAVAVAPGDEAMARHAHVLSYHVMPLRTGPDARELGSARIKYPADLVRKNGPIMKQAAAYNIYVNCKAGGESCWGDPEGFQRNLTGSSFAALLKQYTKSSSGAYTLGGTFTVKYHTYTKLFYQNDLLSVLHAALAQNGKAAGYTVLYHVFLPKGTDTCFDRTRFCYSPDRPRTNNFCAYHESVAFKDVSAPVIVSIEPYQKVGFCASRASSGASALTNSTASTLAHETFESITDPGPPFAWFNFTFGSEVADLCETFQWKIAVGGVTYSVQPMYSNHYHACADGP